MQGHSSMPSSPRDAFSNRLLAWWDNHGRKDLPWQQDRTPYRVWVSEIMLQQTQVSTVIDYFERWMKRFPELSDLAQAVEDEVMGLWSGLGYYSRARNLHKAARTCMERFEGKLPSTSEQLVELPGIGQSTANAIVSLSLDQPAAILDGNVKRVLARHAGIEGWPGQSRILRQLWTEAESRLPQTQAADYSQASMDLGALVCTRTSPACGNCPVNADCSAYLSETVDSIPAPKPKKPVPSKRLHLLVFQDETGRVLLERRPPAGIWGGLWSFPEADSQDFDSGTAQGTTTTLDGLEHRLTHLHLRIQPTLVTMPGNSGLECSELNDRPDTRWFKSTEWNSLGLPKPIRTLLDQLDEKTNA